MTQQPPPYPPQHPPAGPPVPYGYGYPPAVIVAAGPTTSGWATASMVLGIIGALGGWCMLAIPCIVAIVAGHIGLNATKHGARGGRGQAVTGLILGYLFALPYAWLGVAWVGAVASGEVTPVS